ncbi:Ankyrin repeat protein [Legionella busanensis]|uniref:Ankyrin repeat protein n=1 Tax=Legionella busanensis TaxID=190655 RepID=A0A378KBR8_9GAMM|nr:DnaJ domain-containing protein [Legionella busanensis]STX81613.1 Ankyrin repeat protein [Legionella busanensis]
MSNYYTLLGVRPTASAKSITCAYQRLLASYLERGAVDTEIKRIHQIYDTLMDPTKRRFYDLSLLGAGAAHYVRFEREGLTFHLVNNPKDYNYYDYISALFGLSNEDRLIPGTRPAGSFYAKLDYVLFRMYEREKMLQRLPKLNKAQQAELALINRNTKYIGAIMAVLFSSALYKKDFYDLTLGIISNPDMIELERLIGGRDILVKHLEKDGRLQISWGALALKQANLLTPENFLKLSQAKGNRASLSIVLNDLLQAGILDQDNFERLLQHDKYALDLENGLGRLTRIKLVNQYFYEGLLATGKAAGDVGTALEFLHDYGLLNELNWKVIAHQIPGTDIWVPLQRMEKEGLFTPATKDALAWTGPRELHDLTQALDQMVAHGLFVLHFDYEKGKRAMELGLSLKTDLKAFFELNHNEREANKAAFKQSFLTKLHAQDNLMSTHRTPWKMIVANVAVAFTGLGLFAIGAHYLLTGHAFFAKTKRQQCIDSIEANFWLSKETPTCA